MNHTIFTRWLPVHLRDMKLLHVLSPSTEAKFQEGQYAVYKTFNKFSALAVDHAHEQNNALIKLDGVLLALQKVRELCDSRWWLDQKCFV